MVKVAEGSEQHIIQHFMRVNPFQIVIALKKQETAYVVEAVNDKAAKTFGWPSDHMPASCYLHDNWFVLLPFVEKEITEIVPVNLFSKENYLFHQQKICINNDEYIFLILHKKIGAEQTSVTDGLTGLKNFRTLQNQWDDLLQRREKLNVAFILVDLDRFKKFNESLGKAQADHLLIMMAQRFNRLGSQCCEVYRLNGDKFLYVQCYRDVAEVEQFIAQIQQLFDSPIIVDGQDYFLTASIGVSTSVSTQKPKLDYLLREAEYALAYVKEHERQRYRFYSKEMSDHVFPNEALMEAHLRRAIEFDELFIYLQPQKNLDSGNVDSFEALIRWENRKFGFVSPGQFIPLAESSGLILPIGYWVIERVCQYMQEWQQKGYRPVRIAVNISPKQFKQKGFVESIRELLVRYNIEPSLLELEITESSMMNEQQTTAILKQLKDLGVYVSVDDFGTGYSSLSYLKAYPIDIIKIDQSFIADIEKDEKNEAIVRAIILLSHTLGLEVIAEGVEEVTQEQFLKNHHCQKVQGYLYNKPLPVEQMIAQYLME